jgi:tRNA pseudouridine55 synthase
VKAPGLILSVNKPLGWTSFDVVNKLRGALRYKSVGHAGTLDPAADGVLIVLCGEATARSGEFMDLPKRYRARIRLGITTPSDDLEGVDSPAVPLDDWNEARIAAALAEFVGNIEQVPPAVSAVKVAGRRSYKLARAGQAVDLAPRPVQVYEARVLGACNPDVDVVISCSRGTYIRSIARDLGARLEVGGTLAGLTRLAIGPYRIEQALPLSEILKRSFEFASG